MKHLIFAILLVVSGCSTLNKKDCENLDWKKVGQEDGEIGRRRTHIAQHVLACKQTPDRDAYFAGREIGLKKFCTYEGGFTDGINGQVYLGQCRGSKNYSFFKKGRKEGKDIYSQKEKIAELKLKLSDLEKDFDHNYTDSDEMNEYNEDKRLIKKEIQLEQEYLNKLLRQASSRGHFR